MDWSGDTFRVPYLHADGSHLRLDSCGGITDMATMNFFTSELKKIADLCEFVGEPKYVGRACVFRLSDDVTGKMEFMTEGIADHYSALKLTLFNRKEGVIDTSGLLLNSLLQCLFHRCIFLFGNRDNSAVRHCDAASFY